MPLEVYITDRAYRDLNEARTFISRHAPETAEKWYAEFVEALLGLGKNPQAYSLAEEGKEFPFELRQYFHRTRSGRVNRALFAIFGNEVRVLAIRRPGQQSIRAEDLR